MEPAEMGLGALLQQKQKDGVIFYGELVAPP